MKMKDMKSVQAINNLEQKVDKLNDMINSIIILKSTIALKKLEDKIDKMIDMLK